jgi:hypothetical protein
MPSCHSARFIRMACVVRSVFSGLAVGVAACGLFIGVLEFGITFSK